jgi:S1-C subfamily serine protease
MRRAGPAILLALAALVAGCGGGGDDGNDSNDAAQATNAGGRASTATVPPSRVEVLKGVPGNGFDPEAIYRRDAPGVVTVISYFGGSGPRRAVGSGFVIDGKGEIGTNAHVVLSEGGTSTRAREVYVQFADGNQVRARIVGVDAEVDFALLSFDGGGVTLRPLPLGSSGRLRVGEPVAAIGSPFGERQSLSVGVVSALDRTLPSLTRFQISGAIQTDAAINRGNSGGPLLDARGRVVGIVTQFSTEGGSNEGVGYAVAVDSVKRSLRQLRRDGRATYAYVGVSTLPLYPQLARRLGLPVTQGALVQEVADGGPADDAGIRKGDRRVRFQNEAFRAGGDVIIAVAGRPIRRESDVAKILAGHAPGETVTVQIVRGGARREVRVRLGKRP